MKVEIVVSETNEESYEEAKILVQRVLQDFPNATFGEIHALEEPERIQRLGFVSSGAIVINGNLAFYKLPKESNLRALLSTLV